MKKSPASLFTTMSMHVSHTGSSLCQGLTLQAPAERLLFTLLKTESNPSGTWTSSYFHQRLPAFRWGISGYNRESPEGIRGDSGGFAAAALRGDVVFPTQDALPAGD